MRTRIKIIKKLFLFIFLFLFSFQISAAFQYVDPNAFERFREIKQFFRLIKKCTWHLSCYQERFGAFTEISATNTLSSFPTTYNANLKITVETGTTSVASITTLGNLASVGTITSGTWNGATVGIAYGGTAQTSFTAGLLHFGSFSTNASLNWNNTDLRLGIGTTTPGARLSVSGASILNATSTIYGILTNNIAATSSLLFNIPSGTSTPTFSITSSGYLGIGTSTPNAGLTVASSSAYILEVSKVTPSATINIDWGEGNQQVVKLNQAGHTLNFVRGRLGGVYRLILCQDGTGSRTVTVWDSLVVWNAGTPPTLSTTANKCDVTAFIFTTGTGTQKYFGDYKSGW